MGLVVAVGMGVLVAVVGFVAGYEVATHKAMKLAFDDLLQRVEFLELAESMREIREARQEADAAPRSPDYYEEQIAKYQRQSAQYERLHDAAEKLADAHDTHVGCCAAASALREVLRA